jgi:predicted  nucleic acid-binding Zn-ribbon protein
MIHATREEFRADIKEIVTEAIDVASSRIIRMVNEDLAVTNQRIDRLDRKMTKGFKAVDQRFDKVESRLNNVEGRLDNVESRLGNVEQRLSGVESRVGETNQLLRHHMANPSAHQG